MTLKCEDFGMRAKDSSFALGKDNFNKDFNHFEIQTELAIGFEPTTT